MRALVEEMDVRLARLAPELTGDSAPLDLPDPPGRALLRRQVAVQDQRAPASSTTRTRAEARARTREGAGAGLYFQLADGECFVAGGMWMPARPALERIREEYRGRGRRHSRGSSARRPSAAGSGAWIARPCSSACRGDMTESHPAERWLRYRSFTGRGR